MNWEAAPLAILGGMLLIYGLVGTMQFLHWLVTQSSPPERWFSLGGIMWGIFCLYWLVWFLG